MAGFALSATCVRPFYLKSRSAFIHPVSGKLQASGLTRFLLTLFRRIKMNIKINSLTSLKNLPLISVLATGLVLSPTLSMADNADRGRHKTQYSDGGQSHSKGHKGSKKHGNKAHYKSQGKRHKGDYGHSSKHHYTKGHGNNNDHAHYKRGFNNHRYDHHDSHRDHHTSYVVNEHHYSDYAYGLDPLRLMIGLHTNNFDIIFRD